MSIEGQGHFFTINLPCFVSFVLYKATISGERLQDHWSSGFKLCFQSYGFFNDLDMPFILCSYLFDGDHLHKLWVYVQIL